MASESGSEPLGQAGCVIAGSGDGGAGGQYVFANLEQLDEVISEAEVLRDEIKEDAANLRQAQWLIEPPSEDIMSRIEAKTTVYSLGEAIEHNTSMVNYIDAQLAKLRAARDAYVNTEAESAARLHSVDEV